MNAEPPFPLLEPVATEHGPLWCFEEACGLHHERQVIILKVGDLGVLGFCDQEGRSVPMQRSREHPEQVFLLRGVAPYEKVTLHPIAEPGGGFEGGGAARVDADQAVLMNDLGALKVWLGEEIGPARGGGVPGPVQRLRIGQGEWRGGSVVETRRRLLKRSGVLLEEGPVRVVYRYRLEFEGDGFYQADVTLDAGATFARVDETAAPGSDHSGCGDQLVWDFSGSDLPTELYLLDSGAHFKKRAISYHFDARLGRLAAWTQQSQHLDYLDGFAIGFRQQGEVVGFVTLEGGRWRGDKLNHLEAWARRWLPGVPESRRDLPAAAKADSYPGPERIAARGGVVCEPHFNVEGWISYGQRSWALVLTTVAAITPSIEAGEEPLGHFDLSPDRQKYARHQSLLRRLHIQRGVMPLQFLLNESFNWPEEDVATLSLFSYPNETLDLHFTSRSDAAVAVREMTDYLEARVYGFWEGAGIAYSNPVVSRKVAPEMFRYEWLAHNGALSSAERQHLRALFAFLTLLYASDNYYTGDAAMLPSEHRDSTEPSLAGMANQNFYTDAFNVLGVCAQVFHHHPRAAGWRLRFGQQWRQQLAFHVYPESGVWEESHTYYEHVLHTILPTLLRRRADACDDFFADAAMQKLVASSLSQLTPRDAFMAGRRTMIPFGDHGAEPKPAFYRQLMLAFEEAAPTLSAQLAWAAGEFEGTSSAGEECAPSRPKWAHEALQGLGVFFRTHDTRGVEALLALRSGAAWGHHHNDDGSFQLYARGRALIVDSCFGNNQPQRLKFEAAGHSRWSLRDLSPVNFYWRFNRGWVTAYEFKGRFPYARSFSPVYTVQGGLAYSEIITAPALHWRTVVLLGPTTYLILDEGETELPQVVHFHLAGGGALQEGGQTRLDFDSGSLILQPLWGVEPIPHLFEREAPADKVSGIYRSTAVTFDMGVAPSAAFLVHVGDDPPEVEPLGGGKYRIRFEGRGIELIHEAGEALRLRPLGTGEGECVVALDRGHLDALTMF